MKIGYHCLIAAREYLKFASNLLYKNLEAYKEIIFLIEKIDNVINKIKRSDNDNQRAL